MKPHNPENDTDFAAQNTKAKLAKDKIASQIARIVRKHGLSYDDWRYVARRVRKKADLMATKKAKKLPKVLSQSDFAKFWKEVDKAGNAEHSIMLRTMFYTSCRVAELCDIEVAHVDLQANRIFIDQGKGSKDRYVLFPKFLATALRSHIASHPKNRWLFQGRQGGQFTTRRVQQIVAQYAKAAGVKATPHTFRHQSITLLTRSSGLADAELQLLTGHSQRESLAIYQNVALDDALDGKYQKAMKEIDC
jgi:integrase